MFSSIITGASGFIGSNLVRRLLKNNHKVYVISRKNSNLWRLNDVLQKLDIHIVDMNNVKKLKLLIEKIQPQYIFHLATYGGYPFQCNSRIIVQANILNTVNLMEAIKNCTSLKRFINVGSSSEYGPKSKPMREDDLTEPNTPYGISKVCQTNFAKYFYEKYNLPSVTLRLFSVYGPYEEPSRLIYDIMMAIVKNKKLKLSTPIPRRDFIYIDDVMTGFEKAMIKPKIEGEIFNIGSGKDYSVKEVVKLALEITENKVEQSWSRKKGREFDTKNIWVADIRKAKRMLNWKPRYSLKEGLLKTHKWFQKNNHIYKKDSYSQYKRKKF